MAALPWKIREARTRAARSAERFAEEFSDLPEFFEHYRRHTPKTLRWVACTLCGASPDYIPPTGVCYDCDPPEGWRRRDRRMRKEHG